MSWNLVCEDVKAEEVVQRVMEAKHASNHEWTAEQEEQVQLAADVAERAVLSGALGRVDTVRIGLTGHANPNHEQTAGWANDGVSVSVWVTAYRPAAESPADSVEV